MNEIVTSSSKTSTESYPGCGVKLDFEIGGTIMGGTEVEENSYPWMALIYNFDRDKFGLNVMELDLPEACLQTSISTPDSICGGSLIHPRYILTAAHCVECRTVFDTAVVLGKNDLEINEFLDFVFLDDILVYPNYIRGVGESLKNYPDIALLRLEQAVELGPKLNVICLPTNPSSLYEEESMIVAGWGVTDNLRISDKLLDAVVKVYPNNLCKRWNGYAFLKKYLIL